MCVLVLRALRIIVQGSKAASSCGGYTRRSLLVARRPSPAAECAHTVIVRKRADFS